MSRNPNAVVPVVSTLDPDYPREDPRPVSFRYRGGIYRVTRVMDHWREGGMWWNLEVDSVAWRVECQDRGVYELVMERTTPPTWRLRRVWD